MNLYCGGSVIFVCIMFEERKIVVVVVKVMGLNVVGVDLFCFVCGLLVMEVNLLLGFEGIEVVIGKDIVGMIINFIEKIVVIKRIVICGKG